MSALESIWWDRAPSPGRALLLAPLALAEGGFRAGAALRGALYDAGLLPAERAPVPVISVGNLAVGGAGKTPATLALAERLQARGRVVAILSRGYGAVRSDARVVADGTRVLLSAEEGGDEPVLLARRLPGAIVLAGPRRADLAREAVRRGADVLLLDDGFQHRALARDLDVVVLDAANPFGNGHLLPRGPNREPRSALARAGLCWLSRVDQAGGEVEPLRALAARATGRPAVESRHAPVALVDGALRPAGPLDRIRGRRVLLLCGLARPDGFRRTAAALGATVAAERIYPDHHRYGEGEVMEALLAAQAARCELVLTTEKDAVRIPAKLADDPRLRCVRISAELVAGAEALDAALGAVLRSARADPSTSGRPG